MVKPRKSVIALAFLVLIGFLVFHFGRIPATPLGDGPLVIFHDSELSPSLRQHFLEGNFTIIKKVKALPRPVLQAFTEQGGSRFLLADPGKRFEATDVIDDSSLPRKRLIFAGVSGEKCFVHYEQGGIAHSYLLAFFRLTGNDKMEPVWRNYCGPASDIQDLRSRLVKGECSGQRPRVQIAHDTCTCDSDYSRIIVLRIAKEGEITLGSERVKVGQLARRLREIYGTHAERVLYLFPENDAPPDRVANIIDTVQHLRSEESETSAIPKELQAQPENLNIQIRLVTPGALSAPCPKDCFNWATQGLPVYPLATSGKAGRANQPSAPD